MNEASPRTVHRRRVALIETSDPYRTVPDCSPLLDAGYDVVLCAGPRRDQTCPALDGQLCPLVDDASVVINAIADPVTRTAIARAIREMSPEVPMVVIVDDARREPGPGCIRSPDIRTATRSLVRHRPESRPVPNRSSQ